MASCEREVYGPKGLAEYELLEPIRRKRLVRRSLAQYLCQSAQVDRRSVRAARFVVFGGTLPFLFCFLVAKTLFRRVDTPVMKTAKTAVFLGAPRLRKFVWEGMFGDDEIVPFTKRDVHLGTNELCFLFRVVLDLPQILFYPALVSNLLRWLAYYGSVIQRSNPTRIVNFFEGTVSSSMITAYLGERGIQHCNIQHGELIPSAFCAFCEFDEYRLWGEHFRDLLIRQHCAGHMRVVGVPLHRQLFRHLRLAHQPRPRRLLLLDPFLHAIEWNHDAHFIRMLRSLDRSWEVRVRRHPEDKQRVLPHLHRWNADPGVRRLGIIVKEERPEDLSLEDALTTTRVVAGVSSAVLLEAWMAGCKVVYIPGGAGRDVVMARHSESPNVCYLTELASVEAFLSSPACIDKAEERRVNHITAVIDESWLLDSSSPQPAPSSSRAPTTRGNQ